MWNEILWTHYVAPLPQCYISLEQFLRKNIFEGHLVIELLILLRCNHKTLSVMGGEIFIA